MPDYQWKLTIVERNFMLANWSKLMPEAQEQMLWEADDLMENLPLADKQRLLASLEVLQTEIEDLQQQLQQVLSRHLSLDLRNALEFELHPIAQTNDLGANSLVLVA